MKKLVFILIITCLMKVDLQAQMSPIYKVQQSPFATFIAQRVGDILTVVVDETAVTQDNGDSTLTRENTLTAKLKQFFLPTFSVGQGFSKTAGAGSSPEVDFESKSEYKNNAKHNSNHKLETKLQVRIIEEIKPGEFVVRGSREVNINGKKKKIFISGTIRQRDIDATNQIMSEKIADATVEIKGDVGEKDIAPGLFTNIFNTIF